MSLTCCQQLIALHAVRHTLCYRTCRYAFKDAPLAAVVCVLQLLSPTRKLGEDAGVKAREQLAVGPLKERLAQLDKLVVSIALQAVGIAWVAFSISGASASAIGGRMRLKLDPTGPLRAGVCYTAGV